MRFAEFLNEYHWINKLTHWQVNKYFNNLSEIFDKPSKIEVENNNGIFSTTFSVSNIKYSFIAKIDNKVAIVLFHPLDENDDIFKQRKDSSYIGQLFATVFISIDKMIEEYDINTMVFTADNKKLKSLYKKMEKWIEKRFPQWKFENQINNNFIYKRI